jgi:hypothetical protein
MASKIQLPFTRDGLFQNQPFEHPQRIQRDPFRGAIARLNTPGALPFQAQLGSPILMG